MVCCSETELIRRYNPTDEKAVADVWHRAGLAEYTYLPTWQAFSLKDARRVFREVIAADCEIWVRVEGDVVIGFLALDGDFLDRLYVDPVWQGQGRGRELLACAKRLRPDGLRLHTHQANQRARRFYENHGFDIVRFGISPAPESAPDVEYRWHPPL